MGLVSPSEVPSFFYVQSPMNLSQQKDKESGPQVGHLQRHAAQRAHRRRDRDTRERVPASAQSSRVHRQAFIYIVGGGRAVDSAQVAKLDRIRRQWEDFFLQATDGRMRANTRLSSRLFPVTK